MSLIMEPGLGRRYEVTPFKIGLSYSCYSMYQAKTGLIFITAVPLQIEYSTHNTCILQVHVYNTFDLH